MPESAVGDKGCGVSLAPGARLDSTAGPHSPVQFIQWNEPLISENPVPSTIQALARDLILFPGGPRYIAGRSDCERHRIRQRGYSILSSRRCEESSLPQDPEGLRRAHYPRSSDLSQVEKATVTGHDEVSTADGRRGEHMGIPWITEGRKTTDLFLVGVSRDDLDSDHRQNLIRRGSAAREFPREDGGGLTRDVVRHEKGVRAPERCPQEFVLVSTECYS